MQRREGEAGDGEEVDRGGDGEDEVDERDEARRGEHHDEGHQLELDDAERTHHAAQHRRRLPLRPVVRVRPRRHRQRDPRHGERCRRLAQ